jgi:hypothetical protein
VQALLMRREVQALVVKVPTAHERQRFEADLINGNSDTR